MTHHSYKSYHDGDLILLLQNSDDAAFTEIYDRYHKAVYGYLLRIIKIPSIAEDLLHEVFLKLWEIREKLEIKTQFSAYLFRIGHNKAVDLMKKMSNERQFQIELLYHYNNELAAEHRSQEDWRRYDELVEQALDTLSFQQRKVFELCKRAGKSYQEAAEELHISVHTVKDHMTKALSSLRKFLEERGELVFAFILLDIFF